MVEHRTVKLETSGSNPTESNLFDAGNFSEAFDANIANFVSFAKNSIIIKPIRIEVTQCEKIVKSRGTYEICQLPMIPIVPTKSSPKHYFIQFLQ